MTRRWVWIGLGATLIGCGGIDQRLHEGRTALDQGDPATAQAAFTEVLEARPGDPSLHVLRARAHLAAGDVDRALVDLRSALALDPSHAPSWLLIARHSPDPGEQVEAWGAVLDQAPDDLDARRARAEAALAAGDPEAAAEDLRACIDADPRDSHTWDLLGEALLATGDPQGAWQAWERSTSPASRQPRAVSALRTRADAGDAGATAFLAEIDESRESYLEQAARLYEAGRLQPALEAARKAVIVHRAEDRARALAYSAAARARLAVDPKFAATRGSTDVRQQQRVLEEAIRECEASLELEASALCFRTLGFAHLEIGQPERAERALTRALELEPDHLPSRWRRALAAADLEHWDQVLADLATLEAERDEDLDLLLLKARAVAAHPDRSSAQAMAVLDRAVAEAGQGGPGSFDAYKARGLYAASLGDEERAAEDLERARALRSMPDEEIEQALAALPVDGL